MTEKVLLEREYRHTVTIKRYRRNNKEYTYPRIEVTITDPILKQYIGKQLKVIVKVIEPDTSSS